MRIFLLLVATFVANTTRGADIAPYLPADTDAVALVDVTTVVNSELGKQIGPQLIKDLIQSRKQVQYAIEAAGLDLFKDFSRSTVAMNVRTANSGKPFMLLEGKFTHKAVSDSIEKYAYQHTDRVSIVKQGGRTIYKLPGDKPEQTMFSAVIKDGLIVVGPTAEAVEVAFLASEGKATSKLTAEMNSLVGSLKPTAAITAVAWVRGQFANVEVPNEQLQARLQNVDWMSAAIAIDKDIHISLACNASDGAAAKQLSDLVGGMVALLRLQLSAAASEEPSLLPLVDLLRTVKATPGTNVVNVTGTMRGSVAAKAFVK
ncbi:MAG: hypothetical protein R3B84_21525 [Zavarzinella sp.]